MFLNRLYREEMQTRRPLRSFASPLVTLFISFLLLFSLLRTIILLFNFVNKNLRLKKNLRLLALISL